MNLLTDRGFFLIPPEVLEDSWSNVRQLLGTRGNNFPVFSRSHFWMFGRRRHVLGILYIMKLCMWSCCQRTILPSDMQNSARILQFHFIHYPPYQKGKTVLGTTNTRKEVVLEKLHWLPAKAREKGKLTNVVKTLINEHSKKQNASS